MSILLWLVVLLLLLLALAYVLKLSLSRADESGTSALWRPVAKWLKG